MEEGRGQDEFVRVLISAGARPDIRNPVLETIPFHEAVRKHDPGLLRLLVRNVRDINIQARLNILQNTRKKNRRFVLRSKK